jgi:uncharacterized membrane protein
MTISMSEGILWFYESGGERRGPVTATDLLDLHRRGEIMAESLVWRDGFADWIPFASSELAPSLPKPSGPPPVPMLAPMGPPPVPVSAIPFVPRTVRLRPDFRPSIRSCYGRAWELLKTRFWPFIGCFALITLILSVAYQFYLPAFFLTLPLMGGLYWYILRVARGETANFEMLFEGFRRQFGPLAIANLILSGFAIGIFLVIALIFGLLIAALGAGTSLFDSNGEDPLLIGGMIGGGILLLFILLFPLMILSFVGYFATLLILEGELKAGQALSLAWTATKPHLFKIGVFSMLGLFLTYAGILALYFGVFITGAWSTIASVYLYEDAFGEDKAGA